MKAARSARVSADTSASVCGAQIAPQIQGCGRLDGGAPRNFTPHPLLRNRHAQTIWPAWFRLTPRMTIREQRLERPDGDFFRLGWSGEENSGGPVVFMVHGYSGGFESKYVRGLAQHMTYRGWRVAMLELRGVSSEHRARHVYHHGDTEDLRLAWKLLREAEPTVPIAAVGWSLGGSIVLNALGEEEGEAPLFAAAAACVPFKLAPCAEHVSHGFARLYQDWLMNEMRVRLRRKFAETGIPDGVDWSAAQCAVNYIEFDNACTAPLHGFRDALDYYTRCECGPHLLDVQVPTLIVQSDDDPFMAPGILPLAHELSPFVSLEITRGGGHVGFISASRFGLPCYWLERRIEHWLCTTLAAEQSKPEPRIGCRRRGPDVQREGAGGQRPG